MINHEKTQYIEALLLGAFLYMIAGAWARFKMIFVFQDFF